MKATWAAGIVFLGLAGCGQSSMKTITYEGAVFSGDLSSDSDDRAGFVATGGPASVSLEGARQAAAFQAVQHCIDYLGSSDIAWVNGPDAEDSALVIQDNEVVLSGRCIEP